MRLDRPMLQTAFLHDDCDAFEARLYTHDIAYNRIELLGIGERRMFLHAPSGALIEAAFRDRTSTRTAPEAVG